MGNRKNSSESRVFRGKGGKPVKTMRNTRGEKKGDKQCTAKLVYCDVAMSKEKKNG